MMNKYLWFLVTFALLFWISASYALEVGKPTTDQWIVPACNAPEQMEDILSRAQKDVKQFGVAFEEWNAKKDANGEPLCGFVQSQIMVLDILKKVTIGKLTVTMFVFIANGYPVPLVGVSTEPIHDGKRT